MFLYYRSTPALLGSEKIATLITTSPHPCRCRHSRLESRSESQTPKFIEGPVNAQKKTGWSSFEAPTWRTKAPWHCCYSLSTVRYSPLPPFQPMKLAASSLQPSLLFLPVAPLFSRPFLLVLSLHTPTPASPTSTSRPLGSKGWQPIPSSRCFSLLLAN